MLFTLTRAILTYIKQLTYYAGMLLLSMRSLLLGCTSSLTYRIHFTNRTTPPGMKSTDTDLGSTYSLHNMTVGVQLLHEADGPRRHLRLIIQTTSTFVILNPISSRAHHILSHF
jgi:hypothetical protein